MSEEIVHAPGSSWRFPVEGNREGVVFQTESAGTISANPFEGGDFNIVWSSQLGAAETLDRAMPLLALNPKYVSLGGLGVGQDFVPPKPENARDFITSNESIVHHFSLGDHNGGLFWFHPHEHAVWGDQYSGVGLEVRKIGRSMIEAIIAATAIGPVQEAAEQALDEFALDIPALRQA